MKMSTLRNQSKPLLYGLVVLFVLAMGNFGGIFDSANQNKGDSENCDPNIFYSCSDDAKLNVTINQVSNRYNTNREIYDKKYAYENTKQQIENKKKALQDTNLLLTDKTKINNEIKALEQSYNNLFTGVDKQQEQVIVNNLVYENTLNTQIRNKLIEDLDIGLQDEGTENIIDYIKNYPNTSIGSNFRNELMDYGLCTKIDSIGNKSFDQELYEKSIDDGTFDETFNKAVSLLNPKLSNELQQRNQTRWGNWVSSMKSQIASSRLNTIINATQNLSNLEVKNQYLLTQDTIKFDYLTFSIDGIEVDVTDDEINNYYEKIKKDPRFNLKKDKSRVIKFVKWNIEGTGIKKDKIKKSAEAFLTTAQENGWDKAIKKHPSFSLHKEITLFNEFEVEKNGLNEEIKIDDTQMPLYDILGSGRNIIKWAFLSDINNIESINLLEIDSDRMDYYNQKKLPSSFNDLGVFYVTKEIPEGYLTLEESGLKDKLRQELMYQKKYDKGIKKFEDLLYSGGADKKDFSDKNGDLWENIDIYLEEILIENQDDGIGIPEYLQNTFNSNPIQKWEHVGTIQNFLNLRTRNNTFAVMTDIEFQTFLLTVDEDVILEPKAIDNETIAIFRINKTVKVDKTKLGEYKKTNLNQLETINNFNPNLSYINLFYGNQKETVDFKDNRKKIY